MSAFLVGPSAVLVLGLGLALLAALTWVLAPPRPTQRPTPPAPPGRPRPSGALDLARAVERLSTVLGTGADLPSGWAAVARSLPEGELAQLARAAAAGVDPRRAAPARLRRTAPLRSLGAALALCTRTGAPAAGVLRSLASALRDLHEAAGARRTAFTGPRSTARILAVLPAVGLGLGMLLGGDPLRVLTGSLPGRLLALAGAGLAVAGWVWMRRLVRRADPPSDHRVDPSVQLELMAGALAAGLPLAAAVHEVAVSLDPEGTTAGDRDPDGPVLRRLSAALVAGVPAEVAARELPEDLRGLGEAAVLTGLSGADLGDLLRGAAHDLRRERARRGEEAAARLGVALVLPTGTTLLPAFVLLGIVPTVVSLLGGTLSLVAGA